MRKEILYTGEKVYFSIHQNAGMVEADFIRLTADEGKAITNGEDITTVADVPKETINNWADCEMPDFDFATDEDYQAALAEFGVRL